MNINLRFPKITSSTEAGQLQQIQSYMHQLVEQLNWALSNIDQEVAQIVQNDLPTTSNAISDEEAQTSFNSIKALIIKSADIVNAYYDQINAKLEGVYVAQSDFGEYAELTESNIKANSTAIEQFYENMQQVITDIESVENTLIEVNAHIKTGLLYYDDDGAPVYGVEIGQRSEIDGEEVFNKYARFTSDKLSFYDNNDNEVAYISDKKLYITHVEVKGSYKIGYLVDIALADGSVITKYIESGGDS